MDITEDSDSDNISYDEMYDREELKLSDNESDKMILNKKNIINFIC